MTQKSVVERIEGKLDDIIEFHNVRGNDASASVAASLRIAVKALSRYPDPVACDEAIADIARVLGVSE